MIELDVDRPICIELFQDFKDLGRFMLRSGGVTIAAGLVIDVSSWCVLNSANTTPPAPK